MAKLKVSDAKAVAAAEAWIGGPRILPAGKYAGRLQKVVERDDTDYDQWSWWFNQIHDEKGVKYPGVQFLQTSLSPKALGGIKAAFDAFNKSTDTDTDDMVGEWAVLYVSVTTQTIGKRVGEKQNRVDSIGKFNKADWKFDTSQVGPDKTDPEYA